MSVLSINGHIVLQEGMQLPAVYAYRQHSAERYYK